jgi:hypothetical protein
MKPTSQHVPFERLADLAEGRAAGEEGRDDREHLAACADCAAQAAELARLATLMRADDSADAPRDVIYRAVGLFGARRTAAGRPGALRRLVAALSFDSGAHAPAYGLRSASAAARQLLFTAGDLDVDLRLAEEGGGWVVSGQVLGPCAAGRAEVYDAETDELVAGAGLNSLCEFALPRLAAGDYTLRLVLDETEVEVPGLSLRG